MKSINLKYSFFIWNFIESFCFCFDFRQQAEHMWCVDRKTEQVWEKTIKCWQMRGLDLEGGKSLNILEWGSYQLSHESIGWGQKLNKEAPLLLLSTRSTPSCRMKDYFFEFIVRVSAVENCYFSHNLPHLIIMDSASGEQM